MSTGPNKCTVCRERDATWAQFVPAVTTWLCGTCLQEARERANERKTDVPTMLAGDSATAAVPQHITTSALHALARDNMEQAATIASQKIEIEAIKRERHSYFAALIQVQVLVGNVFVYPNADPAVLAFARTIHEATQKELFKVGFDEPEDAL